MHGIEKSSGQITNNKSILRLCPSGWSLSDGQYPEEPIPDLSIEWIRIQKNKSPDKDFVSKFPASKTSLIILSSRRGYTARRCGEAGPVPGVGGRRTFLHPGLARNMDLRRGAGNGVAGFGRACDAHISPSGRRSRADPAAVREADPSSSQVKTTEAGRLVRHTTIILRDAQGAPADPSRQRRDQRRKCHTPRTDTRRVNALSHP